MKKTILFFYAVSFLVASQKLISEEVCQLQDTCFDANFSAGYVFKHDDGLFRQVYGYGMGNIITADLCYHSCNVWGIGGKFSYWLAVGKTTFFERSTFLQEIPVTMYVRRMFNFEKGLQLYASLGGGFAWIKEKSYLAHTRTYKGIGEVELGLMYPVWQQLQFTSAFRYLFPRQRQGFTKADVGGFDLRAGLAVAF